jgi:hypothetical protein
MEVSAEGLPANTNFTEVPVALRKDTVGCLTIVSLGEGLNRRYHSTQLLSIADAKTQWNKFYLRDGEIWAWDL